MDHNHEQQHKWVLPKPINLDNIENIDLPKEIKALLIRRGYTEEKEIINFIDPPDLPDLEAHFPDLK